MDRKLILFGIFFWTSTKAQFWSSGQFGFANPRWSATTGRTNLFSDSGNFWNSASDAYGVKFRNYRFDNCTSALWMRHWFWAEHFEMFPSLPRFPGAIYVNMSVWVDQTLPDDVDALFEIRAARFVTAPGQDPYELIPCHGYDLVTGCGGMGSCKHCDIIDTYCKKHLPQDECPPRQGRYAITLRREVLARDMPQDLIGQLKSTQYWMTTRLVQSSTGVEIACGRVWLDVCKFNIWDPAERCVY